MRRFERAKALTLDSVRIIVRRRVPDGLALDRAARIYALANAEASPDQIEAEIVRTPEFALNVVRVASSAAYGARHIESVRHAVDLLGRDQVANIVMSVGVARSADSKLAALGLSPSHFRARSLGLAFLSKMVAEKLGRGSPEVQFTAGLFQEAGYLILCQHFAPQMSNIVATAKTGAGDLHDIERHYFGFTHADVSSLLAEEYKLKDPIPAALKYHHSPIEAPPEFQTDADIAHVASWLAGGIGLEPFPGVQGHQLDTFACKRLGWEASQVSAFLDGTHKDSQAVDSVIQGPEE